jgi:glutamate-5-semialdehyde dehydrogenase
MLDLSRIKSIAKEVINVSKLSNPTGKILLNREINNLKINKITTPLGVVGIIYEARPNVTIDAIALCIRSGNAVVLRGGHDAENSNKILVKLVHNVLQDNDLNPNLVQNLPTDRKFVKELLKANELVDIIIPRGSKEFITFVKEHCRIPIIETGAGVCHTFIEKSADISKAVKIVENAKTRRVSICNVLDTIIIEESIAKTFLQSLLPVLHKHQIKVFADEISREILLKENYQNTGKACCDDFGREFLAMECSIKIVKNYEEALIHIAKFSSKHSEAIITEDKIIAENFLQEVDSAVVYHNTSTQFTDGAQFGLGAEIGISTQKLHTRGPFALEKLVCEKWVIRSNGAIRD